MRSKGSESKNKKHIIDIDYNKRIDTIKYVKEIMIKVNRILSSPESALLLRDIYDDEFNLSSSTLEDKLFGPMLYREQESPDDFISFENVIDVYLGYNIFKFFGLSLDAFLSMTRYSRNVIIEKAKEHMLSISNELDSIKDKNNISNNELNNMGDNYG